MDPPKNEERGGKGVRGDKGFRKSYEEEKPVGGGMLGARGIVLDRHTQRKRRRKSIMRRDLSCYEPGREEVETMEVNWTLNYGVPS